ncbi:MAG: FHA domain-containing protein [Myxococcales bacterium]|nr:FHA domain-containing protein [Myxococcales bacterium]
MTAFDVRPFLRQRSDGAPDRLFPLIVGDNLIGREPSAEVCIDLPDVSRRHAMIRVTPEGATVEDLESKNGVVVDGQAIRGVTRLRHGASLALGDVKLELHHPGLQVAEALARAGEITVTRATRREPPSTPAPSIRWPLLATIVFAVVVAALLWGVASGG